MPASVGWLGSQQFARSNVNACSVAPPPSTGLRLALTRRIALFLAAVAVFTAVHAQEDEVERIRLPGLIATYRLVGHEQPAFVRMDAAPAFLLAADEAPDPRLPSQGWTAEWRGVLEVLRPGKYRFAARRNGALSR